VHVYDQHRDKVRCLAFAPQGDFLASGANDGRLILRNVASNKVILRIQQASPVCALAFSPDGKTLAYGTEGGRLVLRNLETGQEQQTDAYHGHAGVLSIAFHPSGRELATGGVDGKVIVWDANTLASLLKTQPHTQEVRSVAFSPDGTRLFSTGEDGKLGVLAATVD
jgi:WD40 repeat protein